MYNYQQQRGTLLVVVHLPAIPQPQPSQLQNRRREQNPRELTNRISPNTRIFVELVFKGPKKHVEYHRAMVWS
ncbi:hypothetical protein PGT21_012857 [Puccinia graminis f. sp. tritici]|uniref:Uncharacterized protein n=1 Tax=Puccinia graminis f. sp. tritici TaxID=56615 RepID=A0A5B0QIC8_PUCGR|nr:hypothetical protein PGT21_012857 [Puccinia graminis f. sp. tritici]